ncbi:sigma-70 family RNA polymerase sigma factor [Vibrio sp. S9_S30]|uniref:sigma-70 family RNA polymerase sigma factor n=1 Tax=Vibrio sp. S9_S30 TaxID=2720226 RepID=UPI00167FFC46|nr:sigma-70 family RNA polymerase sigma factor [Vibrio sp. S9_S30]MBD1558375.1 sigma-70 family RNA polymerase sigma factor [Vibrio sp. S9_S30]
MQDNTDEQLMVMYSKGDQSAFAALYSRHKAPLYRYFGRQLKLEQKNMVEELFQDVWFKVIDARESYEPKAKFTTWLYQIAHNLLIDVYRKRLSEREHLATLNEGRVEQMDENTHVLQSKHAIRACMDGLAPLQLEAFMLKHESGFATKQICDIVGSKPETIKTRLRYAMENLRECLIRKLGGRE